MPRRANNRVGVEVDPQLDGESSSTVRKMKSVESTQSLEEAKAQRQKELLRKKKAERRAHAKLRANEKQRRQDEKKQQRELHEMVHEDVPAPESTEDLHTTSMISLVSTGPTDEPLPGSNRDSVATIEAEPREQTLNTNIRSLQENEYPFTAEIVAKNPQQHSRSVTSADAAAVTIQEALKKRFKKCKSMFRQSPRVFTEEIINSSHLQQAIDLPQSTDTMLENTNESSKDAPVDGPLVDSRASAVSLYEDIIFPEPIVPPLRLQNTTSSRRQSRPRSATSSSSASSCSCSCSDSCSSCSCSCSCSCSESETDSDYPRHRRSSRTSRTSRSSQSHLRTTRRPSSRRHSYNSIGPPCSLLFEVEETVKYNEAQHFMATRIQALVRGYRGRVKAHRRQTELNEELRDEALHELQQEACLKIQCRARGLLVRKKMPISDGERRRRRRRRSQSDNNSAATPLSDEDGSLERGIYADPDEIGEWPQELDMELQDEWEELNQVLETLDGSVTQSQFLSRGRLRVFCGTWNMHAKKPTDDLRLWIRLNKYHIVAVGSEECVNSIAKSVVFTSKKSWENQLRETLGEDYVLVASHALTAIHNVVFVHTSVLPLLGNIQSDTIATGLGNQLGNKGGVGISFTVGTTSFAFVSSHFDAHQRNVSKRNGNFHRINHELRLSPTGSISSPTGSVSVAPMPGSPNTKNLQGLGRTSANRFSMPTVTGGALTASKRTVSERFDRIFWYGDLNYRINGTRRMVDTLLLRNQHEVLYANDQLQREMKAGNVFTHYQEGRLNFRPTYKFDKRSDVYDSSSKQRIPSWTDRVLYLSNDQVDDIELLSYRSQTDFRTSDHRPVCAIFQVNFTAAGITGSLLTPRRDGTSNQEGGQSDENHVSSQACTVQ